MVLCFPCGVLLYGVPKLQVDAEESLILGLKFTSLLLQHLITESE